MSVEVEQADLETLEVGEPLLILNKVTKTFGGLTAVENVDLSIWPREIISIIGPNGAGKTTVFNLITGIYQPSSGEIHFNGQRLAGLTAGTRFQLYNAGVRRNYFRKGKMVSLTPDRVVRRGIARTFQNIRLFNNMTVLENVLVGQHTHLKSTVLGSIFRPPQVVHEEEAARQRAIELLSFFGSALIERLEEYVINLSYADRRRVEIARALAAQPKLLLLDEPTAGMNEAETVEVVKYVRRLRDELGLTILLIEHKLTVTMGLSDRIAVLDYGRKIAEGLPEEVRRNEKVITAYLGTPAKVGRDTMVEGEQVSPVLDQEVDQEILEEPHYDRE